MSSPVVIRPASTCVPPYQSSAAVAAGMNSSHAISTPRDHHQTRSSVRACRLVPRANRAVSAPSRANPRTTRIPLKLSAA